MIENCWKWLKTVDSFLRRLKTVEINNKNIENGWVSKFPSFRVWKFQSFKTFKGVAGERKESGRGSNAERKASRSWKRTLLTPPLCTKGCWCWSWHRSNNNESQSSVGRIFGYSNIFKYIWTNIFICQNIHWFCLGRIHSDIHSWSIHHDKYILIFLRP